MKEAINALTEFQELKSQYSLHFTIAEECLSIFNKKKLVEVAGVEQNMVTGVDTEGKVVSKDIWKQMTSLLNRDNLSSEDRVRLIMLYLLTQSALSESDRKSMLDHAKIDSNDLEALRRLMLLCGDTNVMAPKTKKKADDYTYEVSRYVPRIKNILQDSIGGVLDTSSFASVKGSSSTNNTSSATKTAPVSLRNKSSSSAGAGGAPMTSTGTSSAPNSASTGSISRSVVLFVIGGVTYSEIRSAYELAQSTKREVYIGGTQILNPHTFIENLRTIQ